MASGVSLLLAIYPVSWWTKWADFYQGECKWKLMKLTCWSVRKIRLFCIVDTRLLSNNELSRFCVISPFARGTFFPSGYSCDSKRIFLKLHFSLIGMRALIGRNEIHECKVGNDLQNDLKPYGEWKIFQIIANLNYRKFASIHLTGVFILRRSWSRKALLVYNMEAVSIFQIIYRSWNKVWVHKYTFVKITKILKYRIKNWHHYQISLVWKSIHVGRDKKNSSNYWQTEIADN